MTSTQFDSNWLVRPEPRTQARLRLFCFPYAGGGARVFQSWAAALPPFIEVCAVQLPGHEKRLREAPLRNLRQLVAALSQVLQAYADKPFVFFGHSMGAKLCFELARCLRCEHKLGPAQLFVSGCRAPHLPRDEAPTYNLPEPEFIEKLRRLNGTPREVLEHPEMMQLVAPILRADFEVVETYDYAPEPPLSCPITAIGGLQDDEVAREQLEAWRSHTSAAFVLRMLPGDHFFLHAQQAALLRVLAADLHQLVSRSGGTPPR